jgi:beta-phosphoglucomutase-like phosphatase (HAD superfamily)
MRATEGLGMRGLFAGIVTGDDVLRRKPAPDSYLEAARRLGVDPTRSIAIEDSGPGIAAARAAGMKTVAIPHWLTAQHDLSGADLRLRTPASSRWPGRLGQWVNNITWNAKPAKER